MPATFLPFFLLAPSFDGWLGIFLADRDEAVVNEVIPGSPAAKAGLAEGDVLLAVGDEPTPTHDAFIEAIRRRKAGDRVGIKLRRDGKERIVVVQLAERPEELPQAGGEGKRERPAAPATPYAETRVAPARGYLGISVRDGESGVVVDRVLPDSPAAAAGVRVGDVVVGVGDRRIDALGDLDGVLRAAPAGTRIALSLRSDAGTRSVTVTLAPSPDAGAGAPGAGVPGAGSAPVQPQPPAAGGARQPANENAALEAEIKALRAEIAELRRQVEALRKERGRE